MQTNIGSIAAILATILAGCGSPRAPAAPDIEVRQLGDGVWLHTSYYDYPNGTRFPSNGMVVESGGELTLIDTAWGEIRTLALLDVIAAQIGLPVTRAVITHFHNDRLAGVDVLESRGIEAYAHPLTRRLAIRSGLPVPDLALESLAERGSTVTLGKLEVFYPGPGHAPDNVMVWLPAKRILFGGCAIRALASGSAGNTADAEVGAWIEAVELAGERYGDAVLVVPGHGEPGKTELFEHTSGVLLEAGP